MEKGLDPKASIRDHSEKMKAATTQAVFIFI